MDDNGNILARRYSKSHIFVKGAGSSMNEETAIGSEVLKSPNQGLELEKVMKVNESRFLLLDFLPLIASIFIFRYLIWKSFNQT